MERRIYDRTLFIIVTAIIFIGLIVYFTVAHPLYIFDTDDWVYTYYSRDALPIWGKWNPTKVLPETMMPLISLIGSHVFYPFCHDYIQSLGIAYSLFFSGLIVSYLCAVVILCKKLFGLSFAECSFLVFFMLLLHYLPYKVSLTRQNLFFGGNVTCHFNYLLPALLNFIVVTFYTEGKRERSNIRIGLLILATYLCINSNLWHSIVIASYMGAGLLASLVKECKAKSFSIRKFLVNNKVNFIIIFSWLIAILFESSGGRAKMGGPGGFLLKESAVSFIESLGEIRISFWAVIIAANLFALILFYMDRMKQSSSDYGVKFFRNQILFLISMAVTIVYLILLAAVASPNYLPNSKVMVSWMGWLILITLTSISYIIKRFPKVLFAVPLLIYILVFRTISDTSVYAENIASKYPIETIKRIDDSIIRTIVDADNEGLDYVEVHIPSKICGSGGWPVSIQLGNTRIPRSLYMNGITSKEISVSLIADDELNEEFNLY